MFFTKKSRNPSLTTNSGARQLFAAGLLLMVSLIINQADAIEPLANQTKSSTTELLKIIQLPLYQNARSQVSEIRKKTQGSINKLIPASWANRVYLYTQSELPVCGFLAKSPCFPSELKKEIEETPLNSIDVGSLLGSLVFASKSEQTHALNTINALFKSSAPFQPLDFPSLFPDKDRLELKFKDQPIKDYIASFRVYSANQAFALSNILSFYEERLPIALNKTQRKAIQQLRDQSDWIKNSDLNLETISQATLSHLSALYRLLDQSWNSEEVTPGALQRETNQLLAELLEKMDKIKELQEKSVMALSLLLLASSDAQRPQLAQQAEQIAPIKNS